MNTCYLRVKFLLFLLDIILFLLFLQTINILISTFCYQQFSTLPFHLFSFTLSTNNSPFSVLPFFYELRFFFILTLLLRTIHPPHIFPIQLHRLVFRNRSVTILPFFPSTSTSTMSWYHRSLFALPLFSHISLSFGMIFKSLPSIFFWMMPNKPSLTQTFIPFSYVTVPSKKLTRRRKYLEKKSAPAVNKPSYNRFKKRTSSKNRKKKTPPTFHALAPNGELLTASDVDLLSVAGSCSNSTDHTLSNDSTEYDYVTMSHQFGLLGKQPKHPRPTKWNRCHLRFRCHINLFLSPPSMIILANLTVDSLIGFFFYNIAKHENHPFTTTFAFTFY